MGHVRPPTIVLPPSRERVRATVFLHVLNVFLKLLVPYSGRSAPGRVVARARNFSTASSHKPFRRSVLQGLSRSALQRLPCPAVTGL